MRLLKIYNALTCAAFLVLLLPSGNLRAEDERLWVDVKINGKPVKMVFDTGAESSVLFRDTAAKLDLKITNAPSDAIIPQGEIALGWTEPANLEIGNSRSKLVFRVADLPKGINFLTGGILGWGNFKDNILRIDTTTLQIESLAAVPNSAVKWNKFPLLKEADILTFILPDKETGKENVLVDTGDAAEITLDLEKWNQWTASHPTRAHTLSAYYMPGAGLVVGELAWADTLSLGQLKLDNFSVQKSNVAQNYMGKHDYLASFGLEALKHFDVIIDGKNGFIYLREKSVTTVPKHNRIGAVFTPETLETDDLLAHVVTGTPAYEAGIRDGDVLIGIEDVDATKWKTDPTVLPLSRFCERPPGTKLHLKLKRGEKEFATTVVLRNLIGPDVKPILPKPSAN